MEQTINHGWRIKAVKSPEFAPMAKASGMRVSTRDRQIITQIVKTFVDRSRKDIDAWRTAIKLAEHPETPRRVKLHDLYNDLKSDGHLIAQRGIRKLAVLSKKFRIVNKATGEEDAEKSRLFQTPWFYNFMSIALDAVMLGTTLIELGDIEEKELKGVKVVPRRNVVPEQSLILLDVSYDAGINYTDPGLQPWLVEVGEKEDLGLMGDICHYLIWKKNALQAWAEFTEKFGIPFREGTTNSRNPADIDRIELMLEQMGSAGYGVFPEGTHIKVHESAFKARGNPFDAQVERMNSEISKAVNGVTMLSDNGASKAQGTVHLQVNEKIIESDAIQLGFKINWDLMWALNKHGYGLEGYEFQWDNSENLSLESQWKIVSEALAHFDIPEDYISEKFGFPIEGRKAKAPQEPPTPPKQKPKANFKQGHPHAQHTGGPTAALLYDLCCSDITNQAPEQDLNQWEKLFTRLFKKVFDKKDVADIPADQHLKYANILNKAFQEGFNERLGSLEYDSPNNYRIAMMEANIFRFSAAATWQDVLQLNQLASDSKDYREFKEKAETYKGGRLAHLQVEYNHAVAASQNAANYLRQKADEDVFDLEYQTIGDDRVRDSHRAIDGLVAPVDDTIWNTIYPPNGWGCRCEVVQVPKGSKKYYDPEKVSTDSVQKGFKMNYGQTNQIFEAGHAYFKEFPEVESLSARKYGRPNYVTLDRSGYAETGISPTDQKAYEKWWKEELKRLDRDKEHLYYTNYTGISYKLDKKLLEKWKNKRYEGQNRVGIAGLVESILQHPDEVWLNRNSRQNKATAAYRGVYLKNYKDGLYAVITNTENEKALEVVTWYKVDPLEAQELGQIRHGILMKAKK